MVLIGVLALQGDFAEHKAKIASLGAETVDIRQFDDLHKPLMALCYQVVNQQFKENY